MRYSRLGDTGLIVSRLSFGSTTFGPLARPGVTMALVVASRADQLADDLASSLVLPPAALDEIEKASFTRRPYPQWFSRVIRDPVADTLLDQ